MPPGGDPHAGRVVWEGGQAGSGNRDLGGFMILGSQGSVVEGNQG